ncbi:tlde1 domain-containing protein [uncultured Roseibium sp.]|uniref:tlde1 domain-containing protein n=1 Tax=uncultured Roseibium sp. TaxID=1936171 RepID=UPI0026176302|nr:tlde1 domain-containing protein [uncultured Roseibium sp.]
MAEIFFYIREGWLVVKHNKKTRKIRATSGRPPSMNDPRKTSLKNEGPIPVGTYLIKPSELSDPSSFYDVLRRLHGDWGDWRVSLRPLPSTDTLGRSGFFIHGGGTLGSAGCIDIGGGVSGNADTNYLKKIIKNSKSNIQLNVIESMNILWDALPDHLQNKQNRYA